MEFNINISGLFTDIITKVDNQLQVCRNASSRFPDARLQLFEIVNKMGEASARAQGLAGAITTGRKLEMSDHCLYIMKDPEGSRGRGSVVGILKIGRKRLFVYDRHGQQWEMNPLCVLDFYVHESRQRMGCGRRLFDFMLKDQNTCPEHFAVDRPSHKFASFLGKHYSLQTEIPQVNNFVIFDGFFTKRPAEDFINNRRSASNIKPADYPQGSDMEIQGSKHASNGSNYSNNKMYNYNRVQTAGMPTKMDQRGLNNGSRMGVGVAGPHRHQNQLHHDNSLRDLNLNPRSANDSSSSGNGMSPRGLSDVDLRSLSAGSSGKAAGAGLQLQSAMYSRHQAAHAAESQQPSRNKNAIKSASDGRIAATSRASGAVCLNGFAVSKFSENFEPCAICPDGITISKTSEKSEPSAVCPNGITIAKPSEKLGKSPPLLQRDGPSRDYAESFNMHQNYQGRAGHLVLPPGSRPDSLQPSTNATTPMAAARKPAQENSQRPAYTYGYYTNPALHTTADTSWTVFGVTRNQQHSSARAYGSGSKLWR